MMGICELCAYWEAPQEHEWEPVRRTFGTCLRAPHVEAMTEWGEDERVMRPEYADRTAAASDASGYAACLRTKPEHGCTMFSAKP
jgi:hypothetical protein